MEINRLYFVQHGLAADKAENPERPLSRLGVTQTAFAATQLHKAQTGITHIFHSGKLRAAQTAEIFATELQIANVSTVSYLSPDHDVSQTIKNLQTNTALYIGHLPHLDKLVAQLVTNNENKAVMHFQNSAILCLESNQTRYRIQWYITPEFSGK